MALSTPRLREPVLENEEVEEEEEEEAADEGMRSCTQHECLLSCSDNVLDFSTFCKKEIGSNGFFREWRWREIVCCTFFAFETRSLTDPQTRQAIRTHLEGKDLET